MSNTPAPKLGVFGLPEPTEEERADWRELERIEPEIGKVIERAMALIHDREGPVTDTDREEFREVMRALEFYMSVARVKRLSAGAPTNGELRINGKTEYKFRNSSDKSDVDLIRWGKGKLR